MFYQFLRPIAFRRIQHSDLLILNFYLPIALTSILVVVYFVLPVTPPLFGPSSVSGYALSVLVLFPGFFIAALAAVATFQRAELDEVMPDPAPKLNMKTEGKWGEVELTHRLFLCHLFSYLAVLSFASIALCVIGELFLPSVHYLISQIEGERAQIWSARLLIFFFSVSLFWLLSNLIVVTLYGLYFLVERIHRPSA